MTFLALHDLLESTKLPSYTTLSANSATGSNSMNVASLLQFTIPDGKLFYPEPFIASPSYLHSDITYLHIFQYWYWLWFMFIFLICFFFISFVSTVRWCTNRVRPRRETRGVSRSKCGDLITACVPVTWAISIIVNESTDAIDLNDGFGTAELVVGVRAYQWGWEYYYPRSIDLNYSVRPAYSTFIGNSLKYNFSTSKSTSANMLWSMYQNKEEDSVVTPAHLLLIPNAAGTPFNFVNFSNIGSNTLKESSAFPKIRNFNKVYSSHLIQSPSSLSSKYNTISSLYVDEGSSFDASSFGVKKQHNLLSTSATGNSPVTHAIDPTSFNQYLSETLNVNTAVDLSHSSNSMKLKSALSLTKPVTSTSYSDGSRTKTLLTASSVLRSTNMDLSDVYPTWKFNFNDNSDKSGLSYPETKLASSTLVDAELKNPNQTFLGSNTSNSLSASTTYVDSTRSNTTENPRVFNIVGPNSKVLDGEQTVRSFQNLQASKTNLNVSENINSIAAQESSNSQLGTTSSPFSKSVRFGNNFVEHSTTSKLVNSNSLNIDGLPPVLSGTLINGNSLEYDSFDSTKLSNTFNTSGAIELKTTSSKGSVSDVLVGSREKTPRSINTTYWTTFWSMTNPLHRTNGSLKASLNQSHFYLPTFSTYSDYDFRNDQAIEMLDELFWESSYSSFNFYDYLNLSEAASAKIPTPKKEIALSNYYKLGTLGFSDVDNPLTNPILKDTSSTGNYYANSIQMEDYITNPLNLTTDNLGRVNISVDLNDLDDTYSTFKGLSSLFNRFSSTPLSVATDSLATRSYLSVFNYFRSDYEDFSWTTLNPTIEETPLSVIANTNNFDLVTAVDSTGSDLDSTLYGGDLRLSNPATLRPSVKNSIVNYNAFQKVFRPRLDEGRAHVQSSTLADLNVSLPFINDSRVPYTQLLSKNKDSFYSTPLYNATLHKNFNSTSALMGSLSTPMYDFPFLMARTSDTAKFTWIDWFASWKYIEVQPSSVSRYSTLGVPYLRKPFDFNSNVGDKFQDTELYFTRVARSRRNYLTNWSYMPFMYQKSYIWNRASSPEYSLLSPNSTLSALKENLDVSSWYWTSLNFSCNFSDNVNYSSSGNEVYGKSTWRPTSSISSYYHNVSKFVDIMSRREQLYRHYLENAYNQSFLPQSVLATPNNKLFKEVKASFLFTDPSVYSSEYTRDTLYATAPYFKFILLKNLADSISNVATSAPINSSLINNYLLFYFFGSNDNSLGRNAELMKSQFRPLKKGISSMLRLHATGAIAMPIEIRLQVLASSRDVIHSWAIPSASIKIDCVPGYTSHRMMKFLLTGVYWGQCQEICGRYHHWMPIVVYFMKRDLFFLWCTHFVFTPTQGKGWDIGDRRFANFIRFASYDKSSWLTELR